MALSLSLFAFYDDYFATFAFLFPIIQMNKYYQIGIQMKHIVILFNQVFPVLRCQFILLGFGNYTMAKQRRIHEFERGFV